MNKAILVEVIKDEPRDKKSIYRMDPPFRDEEYVFVSAVNNQFAYEIMMFASTPNGKIKSFADLAAIKDTISHARLMKQIDYKIVEK